MLWRAKWRLRLPVDCLATIMDTGRGALSGSWRGCEADRQTRCRAAEVEQACAELSRVFERLAENAPSPGGGDWSVEHGAVN